MCVIIDANKYSDFLNPKDDDMQPLRKWIANSGRIVYSPTKKLKQELEKTHKMLTRMKEYRNSGKLRMINKERVESQEKELRDQKSLSQLKSNDAHIIALALVANVKLLVSNDKPLHDDFKTIVGGDVYQNKSHQHLLNKHVCRLA